MDKNKFYRVKRYELFCNLSEKFKLYRYIFNTVKRVFFDLKKTLFFLSCGTIFPIFLTKKMYRKKLVPWVCPYFKISKKFSRNTRTILEICTYASNFFVLITIWLRKYIFQYFFRGSEADFFYIRESLPSTLSVSSTFSN